MSFKIEDIKIQNFKNIPMFELEIGSRSFFIAGKNGKGKSSLIQALQSPFDSDMQPIEPIKTGEERASINIKLRNSENEEESYRLLVVFTPSQKKGKITVYNSKDEEISTTRNFVDNLFNAISFDILDFIKSKPAEQIKTLRSLLPKEMISEIDKLNDDRAVKYTERTGINAIVKDLEGSLKTHGYTEEEVKLYKNPLDTDALNAELKSIRDEQETYDNIVRGVDDRNKLIDRNDRSILSIDDRIRQLQEEKELLVAQSNRAKIDIDKGNEWLKDNERPSDEAIDQKVKDAAKHNEHHQILKEYKTKIEILNKKKETAEILSEEIKGIDARKTKLFSEQSILPGLTFDDKEVMLNGLPLHPTQVEKSLLIKTGAEIAMLLNHKLKVIFIQDASLLDKASTDYLVSLCHEKGYQLIMEVVNENEKFEIEFMEKSVKK